MDQYQYVKRAISTLCGRPAQLAEGEPLTAEVLVKMCLLTHKVDVHTMLSVRMMACGVFVFVLGNACLS